MSEENFEAAQPPDDGAQQASHPHAQYDKDTTIEHDSSTNADAGDQQVGDVRRHEVGHWLGDEEPDVDSLTSEPPEPAAAQHELGHTLGFRHEHTSPSSANADKPRPRYFDGRFLAGIVIIGLVIIGGLVILLNSRGSAAGGLKTLSTALTFPEDPPAAPPDSALLWFFSSDNDDAPLGGGACVDDYADLHVPICVRNSTGGPIPIGGSRLNPGEERCQPVPVIRTREDEPAAIVEIAGVDMDGVIVGSVGSPSMDTGMLLGMKTVDDHPRDYDYYVELVLFVLPDSQADGYSTRDLFVADSFALPPPETANIEPKIRLFVEPLPPEAGGTNPGFFDIMATIDIEPDEGPGLTLTSFPDPDDDPTGNLVALMAFAYESDLLPHLPPVCEPVSLPPPDTTEEPTDEPPDSSVPVSTEEPVDRPPAVCGDLVCDPATENSDICPSDCQCVDDGVCSPGEGLNCQDCGSSAGSCGAVCADSSQCAEGLSCASGVCWDACLCGADCTPHGDGGSGDDGGGCTGPLVCGDGFCNKSCNEQSTCTVDCIDG